MAAAYQPGSGPASGAPLFIEPPNLTVGERILVAATPVVTLVGLVGLGYPPYAALTRYRVAHSPKNSQKSLSYWQVLKSVKEKEGVRGLYKGTLRIAIYIFLS